MGPYSGDLWIGGGHLFYPPFQKDVSTIFASTPLVGSKKSGEYLINVKSIQIGGKTIPILHEATKLCTLTPYTVLHTSIYKALVSLRCNNEDGCCEAFRSLLPLQRRMSSSGDRLVS
ncbi:Eukaryotic aspartyl protease family protein [Raphanus sativus]|nr:Eukaryotic aspartyl protease family protein [Raphanus sativus]